MLEFDKRIYMKKIYYSASVQGITHKDPNFGWELVQYMKSLGFNVISEHVAGRGHEENKALFLKNFGIDFMQTPNPKETIFKTDISLVDAAEIMICVVDGPSHGVGMEIMKGLLKPRLGLNETKIKCLVHQDNLEKLTWMIRGVPQSEFPNFSISTYTDIDSAKQVVKEFLDAS